MPGEVGFEAATADGTVEEITVDPTGEVGLLVDRVDDPGVIVEDGVNEVAVVEGPNVDPPVVVVVAAVPVVPVAVVPTVVPFVGPDVTAVAAVPEVAADVTVEIVVPDDAVDC